eukprot:COSAG06_NODE_63889_length_261_cov_0.629630_1_plen_48_part_10
MPSACSCTAQYIIEDCFQGGIVGNLSWCPFTHFRSGGDLSQGWNDIAN